MDLPKDTVELERLLLSRKLRSADQMQAITPPLTLPTPGPAHTLAPDPGGSPTAAPTPMGADLAAPLSPSSPPQLARCHAREAWSCGFATARACGEQVRKLRKAAAKRKRDEAKVQSKKRQTTFRAVTNLHLVAQGDSELFGDQLRGPAARRLGA